MKICLKTDYPGQRYCKPNRQPIVVFLKYCSQRWVFLNHFLCWNWDIETVFFMASSWLRLPIDITEIPEITYLIKITDLDYWMRLFRLLTEFTEITDSSDCKYCCANPDLLKTRLTSVTLWLMTGPHLERLVPLKIGNCVRKTQKLPQKPKIVKNYTWLGKKARYMWPLIETGEIS